MVKIKATDNDLDVEGFLSTVEDEKKRQDSYALLELMKRATHLEPKIWGDSIVGFGDYHYKYASGHEGDSFRVGFSPRKQALTIYLMQTRTPPAELFTHLGKHKRGVGCLYIKKLEDVDLSVLEQMIRHTVETT